MDLIVSSCGRSGGKKRAVLQSHVAGKKHYTVLETVSVVHMDQGSCSIDMCEYASVERCQSSCGVFPYLRSKCRNCVSVTVFSWVQSSESTLT